MTTSTQKEILDLVAKLPKDKQTLFWATIKKELAAFTTKELDSRPRMTGKKITMQEIVEEVRAVRKNNAKKASKNSLRR